MAEIPSRLCKPEFRFVLIKSKEKAPFENEWTTKNIYKFDDSKLLEHIKKGGNYGVLGGFGNLCIIDADTQEVEQACSVLPPTFSVRSAGHQTLHRYYFCPEMDSSIRMRNPDDPKKKIGSMGDVMWFGKQVVGAGSIHPNGKKYEIAFDLPIATITLEKLRHALRNYLHSRIDSIIAEPSVTNVAIPITKVIDVTKLSIRTSDEYQGSHPIHSSETGVNFTVNTSKDVWHCFRHDSGGGALQWIAVQEGILSCDQAVAGALRDQKFFDVLKIAEEKYGIQLKKQEQNLILEQNEMLIDINAVLELNEKGKEQVVARKCADEILKKWNITTLSDTNRMFFYDMNHGFWKEGGEIKIKTILENSLKKYLNKHMAEEILHHIKNLTYIDRDIFQPPSSMINLENGIFDLISYQLIPHSRKFYFINKIPINYNPSLRCPNIEKFMKEIVEPDDVNLLLEFFGYCLTEGYIIQKAFMLTGTGSNGKSTLLRLLEAFLGRENVSNIGLVELNENRFASSQLYGKKANIYPDLPDKELKQTGKFKMLTGGDTITAERKFSHSFTFTNSAKLIFSANKLPATSDDTDAFFRRWVIINFPKTFDTKNQDTKIIDKLITKDELSGLLNVAFFALRSLLEQSFFSYSLSTAEIGIKYTKLSDPIKSFIMDCCMPSPESETSKDEIYNAYLDYCRDDGLIMVGKDTFCRKLPTHIKVENSRPLINDFRVHAWRGIRIMSETEIASVYDDTTRASPNVSTKKIHYFLSI